MKSDKTVNESNNVENIIICPYLESCRNSAESPIGTCNQEPSMCRLFVGRVKKNYTKGTRIKLLNMLGEPNMPLGLTGIVDLVDDIGQVHVSWDNGSHLALNVYTDIFEKIND